MAVITSVVNANHKFLEKITFVKSCSIAEVQFNAPWDILRLMRLAMSILREVPLQLALLWSLLDLLLHHWKTFSITHLELSVACSYSKNDAHYHPARSSCIIWWWASWWLPPSKYNRCYFHFFLARWMNVTKEKLWTEARLSYYCNFNLQRAHHACCGFSLCCIKSTLVIHWNWIFLIQFFGDVR